jgi:hypothetical protein
MATSFSTTALDGGVWSASLPSRFTHGNNICLDISKSENITGYFQQIIFLLWFPLLGY